MANEMHPFGAILAYSDDDMSYTSLTLVKMLKPPNITRGEMIVTSLDSTEAWEEVLSGWKKANQMRFEIHCAKALVNTLMGSGASFFGSAPGSTNKYWRVSFPAVASESTPSRIKAVGFLQEFDFSEARAGEDNALIIPGAVRLSGKPTWTSGS